MLFSIIIPAYNSELYLARCINSILTQNYKDFELILVDDGSNDSTPVICDTYKETDSRIQVIHQKNQGQSVARNVGLKHANGEYVIFIDSDDWILKTNFLDKLLEKTYDKPDIIMYGYKKYFERESSYGADVCKFPNIEDNEPLPDKITGLLINECYNGQAWTKAIRRKILIENNIHFVPGMMSEDTEWFLNVMITSKTMVFIPSVFIAYRQRVGSLTHMPKLKSLDDNLYILVNWTKRLSELPISINYKESLMSVLAYYWGNIMVLLSWFPYSEVKEQFKIMKSLTHIGKYSITRRAKLINLTNKILGLRMTVLILGLISKLKHKR